MSEEQAIGELHRARTAQDTAGRITDDGIQRMRARIGVEIPQLAPFNEYASIDTIRHFVMGYGDDNPLFINPEYGKSTRWRSMMAPPTFIMTMGVSEVKEIPPEKRAQGAHALAGVHEFFSGDEWEWFRPVFPGDRLIKRKALRDVQVKEGSRFTGGRSVVIRYRSDLFNNQGELVAFQWESYVRTERDAAARTGKYSQTKRPYYDPGKIAEIEKGYENEFVRGRQTLYWEDVTVNDRLPAIVKGPMLLTDMFAWIRGWGAGVYAFKLAYKDRRRRPKFYSVNDFGAPDVVERVHWDDGWAQRIGNPYAYDFGKLRVSWICHLITNWMGDDGWLWKLSDRVQAFNYFGDTSWVKGQVAAKSVTPQGHHIVELSVAVENQRGAVTVPGDATVILPSREHGPVRLPRPPADSEGDARHHHKSQSP